ncbi:M23 family metallopeptidase [Nitrosomonas mobilis]|uniref:Peptidase M23 n=1 Tax=Nitrosomonas mobilis TaxID=51642 RepID=A0A1G5SHQ6_9PROT|nr:M23 family metallopeptidase [Nitrosomonas mobilis]SCZ86658.1 Peptidase M23 [Nitrosomonas mobilis]HNO74854.1 M23 family metallopeptidase [Nitrosomonas mobilis]
MNIILISDRFGQAKSLTLTRSHLLMGLLLLLMMVILLAVTLNHFAGEVADKINYPILRNVLQNPEAKRNHKIQAHLNKNLDFMAAKVGKMQVQLFRLNELGRRLVDLYGIDPQELSFDQLPGQGGIDREIREQDLSLDELNQTLHSVARSLRDRADKLAVLDSLLLGDRIEQEMLPSAMPLETDWFSSDFGVRIDPFTGKKSFHEGVDFPAKMGTPIKAAAGGVVVFSARHPGYGNMVAIDHGNELVSRYAHASRLLVNVGQVVLKGQKIAEIGSSGRSTGPHLHFEIRHNDIPLNPSRFLKKAD